MIDEICAEIKNYFCPESDRHIDDWTISDGVLSPSLDFPTDYIRIVGSRLNDGVHKVSEMNLVDEEWHGGVWIMSPPSDFLALVTEIEAWQNTYGGADSVLMSPYQSESFGGYSYSKASGNTGATGGTSVVPTWKSIYASRLSRWRRVRVL